MFHIASRCDSWTRAIFLMSMLGHLYSEGFGCKKYGKERKKSFLIAPCFQIILSDCVYVMSPETHGHSFLYVDNYIPDFAD